MISVTLNVACLYMPDRLVGGVFQNLLISMGFFLVIVSRVYTSSVEG